LKTEQVAALTTLQISKMQATDLASMTTAQIEALTTAQVAALTTTQIVALTTEQFAAMETVDVAALTTTQVVAIQTADIAALTDAQITALTGSQVAALTTAQIVALTPTQVTALGLDVASLSSTQLAKMQTVDFAAMTTDQIAAIDVGAIPGLTTAQLANLSMAQHDAITGAQFAAMTAAQQTALALSTPLMLDLDGDGIETTALANGVLFDLKASGDAVRTGWAAADDGLLVIDRNGDGTINDGSELFGSSFVLADGSTAENGFAALASLDSNGDGKIDQSDDEFAALQVWRDLNQDGVSQADELFDLSSLNIVSLSVQATSSTAMDNGNWIGLESSYQTADGTQNVLADVWFKTEEVEAAAVTTVDDAPAIVPEVEVLGVAPQPETWIL
jgi:trimeric autotransporter adhesin